MTVHDGRPRSQRTTSGLKVRVELDQMLDEREAEAEAVAGLA
nr:hypothetical protein [Nannocystis sp.]